MAPSPRGHIVQQGAVARFVLDAVIDHAERFGLGDCDVLCRTPKGTLLRRDYYNGKIWKPAITAAGLPADTTFHDLRHYVCQHGACRRRPDLGSFRWLGHESITTIVDLYGHLVPEASGRARDALDSAFGRTQAHVPGMT